jgi:HPr kinase/phosphorylase
MDDLIDLAKQRSIPVYSSDIDTTRTVISMIFFLNNHLAPTTSKHGVLVDVYGVGILITGESGVGKSESALELVKRGHRLVADDVVEIRRVSEKRLVGEAPEVLRHLMEIRGVGIIDIATMFGISAVTTSKSIDMIVHLEAWQEGKEYDRLGLTDEYTEILNVQVPSLLLPIRPGRNLAVVLEVAARNLRLKQQGFNAAHELEKRVMERAQRSEDNF